MSARLRIPSFHCLDIYRLAVTWRLKKQDIAASFGVTPSRVSHVLRRVKRWVNDSVGDWFFPQHHDLRFLAALAAEKIQLLESDDEPENVVFEGRGWRYARSNGPPDLTTQLDTPADGPADPSIDGQLTGHLTGHLTSQPINSAEPDAGDPSALTQDPPTDSPSPATLELAHRLAQLLTLWKKSKKDDTCKAATIGRGPSGLSVT